jgi:membrane fusion protein (multidrug efflux system)
LPPVAVAWYLLYARYYETTDDAYVNGNQVTLTRRLAVRSRR